MNTRTMDRREWLRAAVGGTALLPFLPALEALGQTAPKKRLLILTTPNGTVMDQFWPGTSTTYKTILAAVQKFQPRMLVLRGITSRAAEAASALPGHIPDFPSLLTGAPPEPSSDYAAAIMGGISIDQHIANGLGNVARMRSKELGVGVYNGGYNIVARGARQPVAPELSPYQAFTSLFSGLPTGGPTGPDPALVLLHKNRRSVFDRLQGQITKLRCTLGSRDRLALDGHVEALRDLEREVAADPGAGSAPVVACQPPSHGTATDVRAAANLPKMLQLQMDNAVAAFACDVTRVITLQFHRGASETVHNWALSEIQGSHHGISHNSEGVSASDADRTRWLIAIETWFAQRFAELLGKLDAIPDGNGKTLLDNCAVVWAHEQSNGFSHQRSDLPYVIAGSCAGALKTGQNLDFKGRSNNDFLITLARAMGVATTTFGTPSYVTGPITPLLA